MRMLLAVGLTAAALLPPGAAAAAPSVDIRNAVADVIVLPEARNDVSVVVIRANPRLPLRITTFMGRTTVDGGLWWQIRGCGNEHAAEAVSVLGVGQVTAADAPEILVRTPLDVRVAAGGAVWGRVAHADSVELVNASCASWLVANVQGHLKVVQAGSGDTRVGQAGSAELTSTGSGSISAREIFGPLKAENAGSGVIHVGAVDGPLTASVAGSGRVQVDGGHVSDMDVSVAGSGDIDLNGVAGALKARVVGSGNVHVARVTGSITKSVVGSGDVRVGS